MEVVFLLQDQWCSHMLDFWARCSHFYFQTHPWILGTGKEFHVDVVQHLVREKHKSRMHLLILNTSQKSFDPLHHPHHDGGGLQVEPFRLLQHWWVRLISDENSTTSGQFQDLFLHFLYSELLVPCCNNFLPSRCCHLELFFLLLHLHLLHLLHPLFQSCKLYREFKSPWSSWSCQWEMNRMPLL